LTPQVTTHRGVTTDTLLGKADGRSLFSGTNHGKLRILQLLAVLSLYSWRKIFWMWFVVFHYTKWNINTTSSDC